VNCRDFLKPSYRRHIPNLMKKKSPAGFSRDRWFSTKLRTDSNNPLFSAGDFEIALCCFGVHRSALRRTNLIGRTARSRLKHGIFWRGPELGRAKTQPNPCVQCKDFPLTASAQARKRRWLSASSSKLTRSPSLRRATSSVEGRFSRRCAAGKSPMALFVVAAQSQSRRIRRAASSTFHLPEFCQGGLGHGPQLISLNENQHRKQTCNKPLQLSLIGGLAGLCASTRWKYLPWRLV